MARGARTKLSPPTISRQEMTEPGEERAQCYTPVVNPKMQTVGTHQECAHSCVPRATPKAKNVNSARGVRITGGSYSQICLNRVGSARNAIFPKAVFEPTHVITARGTHAMVSQNGFYIQKHSICGASAERSPQHGPSNQQVQNTQGMRVQVVLSRRTPRRRALSLRRRISRAPRPVDMSAAQWSQKWLNDISC